MGEAGAELSAPADPREASWRAPKPHEREGVELWEDRAVVAVGRTAEAWAFAFDGCSGHHLSERFLSPARAASASGRAVVVWRDPMHSPPGGRPAAFHLSVAEHGEELYAFTVRGTEIRRSGAIPEALDPARLFRPADGQPDCELLVLQALHTELGLSLPRFALTQGRLHTFTTRSWTRAPREGRGSATSASGGVGPEAGVPARDRSSSVPLTRERRREGETPRHAIADHLCAAGPTARGSLRCAAGAGKGMPDPMVRGARHRRSRGSGGGGAQGGQGIAPGDDLVEQSADGLHVVLTGLEDAEVLELGHERQCHLLAYVGHLQFAGDQAQVLDGAGAADTAVRDEAAALLFHSV